MPVQLTFDDRDETYVVPLTNEGGAEKMKVRKYEWDFKACAAGLITTYSIFYIT